jgi:hypothetical protein
VIVGSCQLALSGGIDLPDGILNHKVVGLQDLGIEITRQLADLHGPWDFVSLRLAGA